MKSIPISSHFHWRICNGCNKPAGIRFSVLILWQLSHMATYSAISLFIPYHQNLFSGLGTFSRCQGVWNKLFHVLPWGSTPESIWCREHTAYLWTILRLPRLLGSLCLFDLESAAEFYWSSHHLSAHPWYLALEWVPALRLLPRCCLEIWESACRIPLLVHMASYERPSCWLDFFGSKHLQPH
jgi:hypothetical protein